VTYKAQKKAQMGAGKKLTKAEMLVRHIKETPDSERTKDWCEFAMDE
jgi:hypothetical protein